MAFEVGQIVEGKVTGITNFGAFVELADGQTGLVHISEVANEYVRDVNQYLKINDLVKVKILNMDKGKIGLSIKQGDPTSITPVTPRRGERTERSERFERNKGNHRESFEDKLTKFLKDSDERQTDLRRNTDSKRGGRGGGRAPSA